MLFVGLVVAVGVNDSIAQDAETVDQPTSFTVESPRALSQAVLMLIERYGNVITYEDAPLVYGGDLQDLTNERHADLSYLKKPGAVREIVPFDETLTVHLPALSAMKDPENVAAVIEQMLKDHAIHNQGGRFRLQQTEGVFHIVPVGVRDVRGEWVSHRSLLEARISVPAGERSGPAMLDAICQAVSEATHTHVVVGYLPLNTLAPYRGVLAAQDEPARSVLLRVLAGSQRRFTWLLDYLPQMQQYSLSIILVPDRTAPSGPEPAPAVGPHRTSSAAVVPTDPGR
jgi:hypothetical protein